MEEESYIPDVDITNEPDFGITNSWSSLRLNEYRKLNQFEMIYNDKKNGTNHWEESIDSIKLKYPKPK